MKMTRQRSPTKLFLSVVLCFAVFASATAQRRSQSSIHFGSDDNDQPTFVDHYESPSQSSSDEPAQPQGKSIHDSLWSSSQSSQSLPISSLGRGSNEYDSFKVNSGSNRNNNIWNSRRTQPNQYGQRFSTNRINFSNSYPLASMVNQRSKRSAVFERRQYYYPSYEQEEECQYHTLINGDSEVLLRKILPIRMRGRTILRHCIRPPPQEDDPRYKVLMRGNKKSSFGSVRVSLKL